LKNQTIFEFYFFGKIVVANFESAVFESEICVEIVRMAFRVTAPIFQNAYHAYVSAHLTLNTQASSGITESLNE
jgi:hypothetical protein